MFVAAIDPLTPLTTEPAFATVKAVFDPELIVRLLIAKAPAPPIEPWYKTFPLETKLRLPPTVPVPGLTSKNVGLILIDVVDDRLTVPPFPVPAPIALMLNCPAKFPVLKLFVP